LAEDDRRRLLRATDDLLERIEQLRLRELIQIPEQLQARVVQMATEIEGDAPRRTPVTLAAAHDYVFRLQRLLLRVGGWRSAAPASASASPVPTSVPLLSLPTRAGSETEAEWLEQVRLVLQRAHDRARYLDAQARAAQRVPGSRGETLAARRSGEAQAAHQSVEQLSRQVERITGRSGLSEPDPPPTLPTSGQLQMKDLVIDLDTQQVRQANGVVHLTPNERACLVALVANQDRVITREALQHLVCGDEPTLPVDSRTLDVHLSHLRAKLGHPSYLETIPGIGFRAASRAAPSAADAAGVEEMREQRRAERQAWASRSSGSPPSAPPRPGPGIDRRLGR
jgi:DNA-binding response OmpR family regulator